MPLSDILILSNGPGEVTTWVRPVVKALRQQLGNDSSQVRISVVLSPCPHATGKEAAIALSYPEVDRVKAAEHFMNFLLWGKTSDNWDWCDRGVVLFLGGDQFFPVVIGNRLGYRTVVYAEWDARWHNFIDRFGVMKAEIIKRVSPKYTHKFTVVGDLMAEAAGQTRLITEGEERNHTDTEVTEEEILTPQSPVPIQIGILPGSKAAKLGQGVPLTLAIAEYIHAKKPETKFVIPVAPTLDLHTLARFADPEHNPMVQVFGGAAQLVVAQPDTGGGGETTTRKGGETPPLLKTKSGLCVELYTHTPAYAVLSQCSICLTTVGANTAELGSLGVPMIVLLPTQQLDAMRAWDGLPGLLANLPGVGKSFAKVINWWFLKRKGLLAWPNIWAQEEVVPELVGKLEPAEVGEMVLDYLQHPEKLQAIRSKLRSVRGEPGAAQKIAQLVIEECRN
ncbi:MAG: lipid-A-disaccharide synthase [Nostocaceae cyanobacterium]|nr:lipid-A-disaccharide synthase [Nostocaceae cyanobacterium]